MGRNEKPVVVVVSPLVALMKDQVKEATIVIFSIENEYDEVRLSGRGSWPRIAHFTVDMCPVALVCLYILSFYDSEGTCVPAMEACTCVN